MSSLAAALSIKLTEVFYVPWSRYWFSLLHSQADAFRSAHLRYLEGTFPAGGKLVHALLVKHPLRTRSSTWSSLLHTIYCW
jgi:hypothetical protein